MTETMTTTAGTPMKHVAMASYVGSAIEYYDFYIYGTAAALVFPKVLLPPPWHDDGHCRVDGHLRGGVHLPSCGRSVLRPFR